MKINPDDLETVYDLCLSEGQFKEKDSLDIELIRSLKSSAEEKLVTVIGKAKILKRGSADLGLVFVGYYESLGFLIDAYLLFDNVESDNARAKNAYLCLKHPDLELDWNFLEGVRIKNELLINGGNVPGFDDWNLLKLQFELHIRALKVAVEKMLAQS
jgi:hypothetical protein